MNPPLHWPHATLRIEELMRDLARNYTIIVVTYNMHQAARVSDYAAFFNLDENGNRTGIFDEFGETNKIIWKTRIHNHRYE